jgi:lipoate-protein ligase A
MPVWRFLPFKKNSAFENMAEDEAVYRENQRLGGPPTLRLFGWSPPSVSIGFFQDLEKDIDLAACRLSGIDVVRRITGGRAVLHDAEITYSLVSRENDPLFPPGILGRYQLISEAICDGLLTLGIHAEMEARRIKPGNELREFCFSVPAQHEILVNGKKICGSAQARGGGAFLQHGSLLLDFDPASAFDLMTRDKSNRREKIQKLEASITSIHAAVRNRPAPVAVCAAISRAIEDKFGIRLKPGRLTSEETALKQRLIEMKYGTDRWNRFAETGI